MKLTVLSGGTGGSRFVQGLLDAKAPTSQVTVIANTADDISLFGLRICPDLDTIMYTLGGGIDPDRGWGRTAETWNAKTELGAYGIQPDWFGLGDRDLATHLVRTMRLGEGKTLSEVTAELCERWKPGVTLLPMSDSRVETHITVDREGTLEKIHFQEFWIRLRAAPAVHAVTFEGLSGAEPAPGVVEAIQQADLIILPPSNPIVSVGPIVAIPGIREALRTTAAPVVGVSPIIGSRAIRGMADQLMSGLGIEISAASVGLHLGARSAGGLLDGWLVDDSDAGDLPRLEEAGIRSVAVPLYMRDATTTAQLARDTLAVGATIGADG